MITLTLEDMKVKTIEELRDMVSKIVEVQVTDEQLIWGICCFNATAVFDSYSTSDVAQLFLSGIESHNNLESVQQEIDRFYEDQGENDSALFLIQYYVERQFSIQDYEDQFETLRQLMEGEDDEDDEDPDE